MAKASPIAKVRVERCRGCGQTFFHDMLYVHLGFGCWKSYRDDGDLLTVDGKLFIRGSFYHDEKKVIGLIQSGGKAQAFTALSTRQAKEICNAFNWHTCQSVKKVEAEPIGE